MHTPSGALRTKSSVERLQLISLNWSLVLVKVGQRVLSSVVVRIVVRVDGLSFKTSNGVELFDGRCAQPGEGAEYGALDLGNLCVLHCVDEGVLRLGSVVLQFLGSIFLAEWRDLIEIHFEI